VNLSDRLSAKGPKRMLALDGGGVRGVLSICFLERIENVLRERLDRPDLRLCDYFDLIAGTSTGAIIAGGLAIGMEVAEIRESYLKLGERVFGRKKMKVFEALYNEKPLQVLLDQYFGKITLGDRRIRTGLCIVTKRADTNSTWPLMNHPAGKFYEANRDLLLKDVIRASAAAPLFFLPTQFEVGPGQTATFVDGGVSMANNPALLLLMVATLKGFPFHWTTGEKKLLLVSVGTGFWNWEVDARTMARGKAWDWLSHLPKMFIQDASIQAEMLLQYLSRSPTAREIDSEMGDLGDDLLTDSPALSYIRYNVRLERAALEELGLHDLIPQLASLRRLGEAKSAPGLVRIGDLAASLQVQPDHFPAAFDELASHA